MYYAKSTGGFYLPDIHGENIPTDAVEIPDEEYAALMQAQSDGKQIIADDNGYPIAVFPLQPARTKTSLLAEVATKRWQVETGGIVVAGRFVATDRESQAQLNNVCVSLKNGLIADTAWKATNGDFTLVTLTDLEPVAQAVAAHVRACFAAEQIHNEAINALKTQEELNGYDINSAWPTQSEPIY